MSARVPVPAPVPARLPTPLSSLPLAPDARGWQLIVGPPQHAVAFYASALAAECETLGTASAPRGLVSNDLRNLLGAAPGIRSLHLQFTDRLFGTTPELAAEFVQQLARSTRVTVTLHDLPQPSDGARNLVRRSRAYRLVAEAAVGVVCNSRHEALLLEEFCRPRLRHAVEVIPLPVFGARLGAAAAEPSVLRPEVALLGYFYPGKGHAEVVRAVVELNARLATHDDVPEAAVPGPVAPAAIAPAAAAPRAAAPAATAPRAVAPAVVALGAASAGHEAELEAAVAEAATLGVTFGATGYLDDDELLARCRAAAVPVAAHQHLSASASINTWIAAGRRPLVLASRYSAEMAELRPGTVTLFEPAELSEAIGFAIEHPESTWLAPGTRTAPDLADVAAQYIDWWGRVA
ncbi:hypothetical protein [Subtercola sp. RTI3]|uniref:hypothetical protein n=1 Tax=Subtercola sp. RTI3 TaxID=3048639 RepID=UPI002B2342BA|nr:hypothetical protein [Subtercola sp. RTI3]MEA9985871.1 hypothetical protein [Subtercola sp. RTI3]